MSKKLTQEEAEQRSLAVGVRMIGKYVNNRTKIDFECPFCYKIFRVKPEWVWSSSFKSCGHCYDPKIREIYGQLTVIKIFPSKSHGCKVEVKCKCGNICCYKARILKSGNTKSCGKCGYGGGITSMLSRKNITGKRFGQLVAIKPLYSKNSHGHKGWIWECKCDCGKYCNVALSSLTSGHTKSCVKCGYKENITSTRCRKDISGKRFGQLVAIKPLYSKNSHGHKGWIWECKCDCGRVSTKGVHELCSMNTKSCGNCNNIKNGVKTSYKSLSLSQFLPISAQHNYKWGTPSCKNTYKTVDWAFVYKGEKVALEYDEWYWHGYKIKQDEKRYSELAKLGWYVIRVRAHNNIPSQSQIDKALQLVEQGHKKVSITLKGWGKGKTFADRKQQNVA